AAASQLAFTTSPQSLTVGTCSTLVTVQARDAFGNAATVLTAATVNLTSNSGTLAFFSDAACGTGVTFVTIVAGGSSANLYFKDNTAGAPTITATAGGLTPANQGETLSAASATRLAFITGS